MIPGCSLKEAVQHGMVLMCEDAATLPEPTLNETKCSFLAKQCNVQIILGLKVPLVDFSDAHSAARIVSA